MLLSNKNMSEQITLVLSLYVQRSGQKFKGDHLSIVLQISP